MKHLKLAGPVFAAAIGLSGGPALAQDYTLTISSWVPPTHGINTLMWPRITEMIEAATDGRVTAEVRLGLAPPPAQIDLIQDGAADLSFIFHGYQPGRFVTTKLIELPGYEGSAEAASVAYWTVYEQFLAAAEEHRGVEVVGLFTHGPAHLQSNVEVTELAQMDGLKVRVPGGVGSDIAELLGATGIQVPAPQVYETLASNAADGVVMPFESRSGFRLTEVAVNVLEMPGGLYRGSFAVIMNRDILADLPDDLRLALEEQVFGVPISRAGGRMMDETDAIGRDLTLTTEGNNIFEASAEDVAAFGELSRTLVANVLEEVAATGVDAQAAYELIRAEMAAY